MCYDPESVRRLEFFILVALSDRNPTNWCLLMNGGIKSHHANSGHHNFENYLE